ncbi:hypothetical protein SAMN05421640_2986 [Ekhidna lutea]|uniref:Uncharacterized protein n=1 Tax=Ekhidna lutea TaxID=447679 RepID=A0A239L6K4_EKHLU|nr:hypothetical protein [Ekhidna lutea]SNT25642.1 hypothetical protein SAMN05421640_2986 [Ekhidna lutea]
MAIITINLTLDGGVLKYQDDAGNWQTVDAGSPSTGVDSGDEVDWSGDDTIGKIKIKPNKNRILDRVDDDDTKKPKGKVKQGLTGTITEKYTISVKPANGGGYTDFDPDLTYPKGGD